MNKLALFGLRFPGKHAGRLLTTLVLAAAVSTGAAFVPAGKAEAATALSLDLIAYG